MSARPSYRRPLLLDEPYRRRVRRRFLDEPSWDKTVWIAVATLALGFAWGLWTAAEQEANRAALGYEVPCAHIRALGR